MSDIRWSAWLENRGSQPKHETVQVKFKDGDTDEDHVSAYYWGIDHDESDIIAYRYKIKEPETTFMHEDLYWLATNVTEWDKEGYDSCGKFTHIRRDAAPDGRGFAAFGFGHTRQHEWFSKAQWIQARKDLGRIMSDEEEEIRAEEWNGYVDADDEPDNVNKPKHYQLRKGYEVYDLRQDLAAKAANGGATYDQYSDWDRAIEYIIRMWGKNRLEDAKKGRWYLDKLIGKLEAQE